MIAKVSNANKNTEELSSSSSDVETEAETVKIGFLLGQHIAGEDYPKCQWRQNEGFV